MSDIVDSLIMGGALLRGWRKPAVRIALGLISGPIPRLLEASGAHVSRYGWAAAAAVGTFLTLWGSLEIAMRATAKTTARLRLALRGTEAGPSPQLIVKRRSEALTFLLTMDWRHGHLDVEGVMHAVRTGAPLDEAPCRVCGRRRTAASRPKPIGILVMS